LKLNVSIDGGGSWTNVWEANNDGNDWMWREITVDLSAFANQPNVIIAWQYVGNDGDMVGIDNVKLTYGIVGVNDDSQPIGFELKQNYPNPFNPSTLISFTIPSTAGGNVTNVSLTVYDVLGKQIATLLNENIPAGSYSIKFNASSLTSGTYFYRLKAGNNIQTKKMILIK
jgi:hypothetical protein